MPIGNTGIVNHVLHPLCYIFSLIFVNPAQKDSKIENAFSIWMSSKFWIRVPLPLTLLPQWCTAPHNGALLPAMVHCPPQFCTAPHGALPPRNGAMSPQWCTAPRNGALPSTTVPCPPRHGALPPRNGALPPALVHGPLQWCTSSSNGVLPPPRTGAPPPSMVHYPPQWCTASLNGAAGLGLHCYSVIMKQEIDSN